ncbi:MAG: hypothetical protein ACOX61_05020 [Brooklawnia sp.]|jgi:hypothetical protein
MSDPVILVLVSVGLSIVVALWAILMWNRRQSARYLMRAVGLILVIVGALLAGLSGVLLEGARALGEWLNDKVLDTPTWGGIALGVVGIISFVIGGVIKAPDRHQAKARRLEREAKQREKLAKTAAEIDRTKPATPTTSRPAGAAQPASEPAKPSTPGATAAGQQAPPPLPGPPSDQEDEVTNILRKHGIE